MEAWRTTFLGYVIDGRVTGLAVTVAPDREEVTWQQMLMGVRQTEMLVKVEKTMTNPYHAQAVPRPSQAWPRWTCCCSAAGVDWEHRGGVERLEVR